MNTNENIIVQLASPERKFVKVYQDFLQNTLLTAEEKLVFIVLKSFVNFSKNRSGTRGEAFPTMDTVCKLSSLSRPRATRTIDKLVEKKIIEKKRRGLTKSNLYILSDYATVWNCDNEEDMAEAADNKGIKTLTPEEHIAELERMGYEVQIKEKGLEPSAPTKTEDSSTSTLDKDYITDIDNCQAERYAMNAIKELFEYDNLANQCPEKQDDIDVIFDILYETLNSTKKTIRIAGVEKPTMTVIGKLMKLNKESIMYSINKFLEQAAQIKNPTAYMLTILYNAPEQCYLDKKNQESSEKMNLEKSQEEKKTVKYKDYKYSFHNFDERTYDYDELERELLRCEIEKYPDLE